MCKNMLESFQKLNINKSCIGLSQEDGEQYFCTPIGAKIIGWDNGIHYCFIQGMGEMVFAVNPETCCDHCVYPIAENFADFLSLILAAHGTNTLQQIILWNKQQYTEFVNSPEEMEYAASSKVKDALKAIYELGITPMQSPFEYVTNLQNDFDYSKIPFCDEFYDATGQDKG